MPAIAIEEQLKNKRKKLTFWLFSLCLVNMIVLGLGPGLGGNYIKKFDTTLMLSPIGCIIYGFGFGLLLALLPYKELAYSKKYVLISLFTSVIFNIGIAIIAVLLIME